MAHLAARERQRADLAGRRSPRPRACRSPTWSTWPRGCGGPSWSRAAAAPAAGTLSPGTPRPSRWPRWCARSRATSRRSSASPPARTARSCACARASPAHEPCPTKLLWTRVQGSIVRTLTDMTLADLARPAPEEDGDPDRMSLEIQNLHVRIEEREILHGVDLKVGKGETHALMGPNGSGKSTLANTDHGQPQLRGHRGPDPVQRRGPDRGRPRRARPRRAVPGLPVPGHDPRRVGGQLPAPGRERAPRGADQGQGLRQAPARERGHAADRPRVREPLPQRGLLGRREEARRDPPARDARARDRRARRDRLGPGHRRAADRLRRRERAARARAWAR